MTQLMAIGGSGFIASLVAKRYFRHRDWTCRALWTNGMTGAGDPPRSAEFVVW